MAALAWSRGKIGRGSQGLIALTHLEAVVVLGWRVGVGYRLSLGVTPLGPVGAKINVTTSRKHGVGWGE